MARTLYKKRFTIYRKY